MLEIGYDIDFAYEDPEKAYEIVSFEECIFSLYDSGWRAEDKEQLASEYNFTDDEADDICKRLAEVEAYWKNNKKT